MPLGRGALKVEAGRDSHAGLLEQTMGQLGAVIAQCGDIGIQIERPGGIAGDMKAEIAQRGQQIVPTPAERGAALLEDRLRGRGKAGQGRVLRRCRGTDEKVLDDFSATGTQSVGTTIQPRRQPVMPKYLEKLLTTIASGACANAWAGTPS